MEKRINFRVPINIFFIKVFNINASVSESGNYILEFPIFRVLGFMDKYNFTMHLSIHRFGKEFLSVCYGNNLHSKEMVNKYGHIYL